MLVLASTLARRTVWLTALVAMLFALSGVPASAQQGVSGNLTAQTTAIPFPDTRDVQVIGLDDSERAIMVRAIFNETLSTYGYSNDIAAPLTVELLWSGAYTVKKQKQPWFMIEGTAGSSSDPDLGLTLNLGLPNSTDKEGDSYTLGCRLTTDEGVVWTARAVAITKTSNINTITRVLARQLVRNLGKDVPYLGFVGTSP